MCFKVNPCHLFIKKKERFFLENCGILIQREYYSAIKRGKPLIQNMGESQTDAEEEYILSDSMHVTF